MFDDDDEGSFLGFLLLLPIVIGFVLKLNFLLLELFCRAVGLVIMGICYLVKFIFEIVSTISRKIYNYVSTVSE